jgi:hypothetical protein
MDAIDVQACSHVLASEISFDRLEQPAVVRRRAGGQGDIRKRASSVRFGFNMPLDILRSPDVGVSFPEATLTRFLAALEGAGPGHLPATLDDLDGAGLPSAVLDELRALVAAGHAETDVVRALYETLAVLVADGTIAAPVSRQFLRSLRRQFGHPDECREMRERVKIATVAALAASVA